MMTVKNLSASYGNFECLKNVSFTLNEGEFICLCGPNGSGKSTLLSILAGINSKSMKISKNSVFFDQKPVEKLTRSELSKNASLMVQNENCVWDFTAKDFVLLGRYVWADENSESTKNLVSSCMKKLDILSLCDRNVNTLSGGEFQKCRIARSLVQESPVLLLDEPCANLDFDAQFKLLEKIREICRNEKKAAIVSIHDLNLASIFADKILLLGKNHDSVFENTKNIFKSEILNSAFGADFGIFIHPKYNVPQVYVKD